MKKESARTRREDRTGVGRGREGRAADAVVVDVDENGGILGAGMAVGPRTSTRGPLAP